MNTSSNTPRVRVVPVKAAPTIQKMDMLSGIRTKEAAQAWGEKHGYSVYADRIAEVDEQAAALEAQSVELVKFAEGQA